MFELEFFKVVSRILKWSEAPGTICLNEHRAYVEKRKPREVMNLQARGDQQLSMYIAVNYPPYFNLVLRTGQHANFDKILNSPMFQ